ncbi:hypothetical protein ACE1SV_45910 [Streptomyces sp. E-15]
MRHTGAVAAAIAGGMLLPSGCGAVDLPLAGVRAAPDGTPYAVFRPCGDDTYRGPHLDGRPRGAGDGPVTTGRDTDRRGLRGDTAFPLRRPGDEPRRVRTARRGRVPSGGVACCGSAARGPRWRYDHTAGSVPRQPGRARHAPRRAG